MVNALNFDSISNEFDKQIEVFKNNATAIFCKMYRVIIS